jgi:hypothetical protein
MNENEFESRLQRTPLKQPPGEWRKEIVGTATLRTAEMAAGIRSQRSESLDQSVHKPTFAATWRGRLHELFWPHPVAWGVIASVWMVLGAVHLTLREPATTAAPTYLATSPGVPTIMELQRELLTAWNEPMKEPTPKPEVPLPPQSCIERRREIFET